MNDTAFLMPPLDNMRYPAKHYCDAVQYLYYDWSTSTCMFCGSAFCTPLDDADLLGMPIDLTVSSSSSPPCFFPPAHSGSFTDSLSSSYDDSDWLSGLDMPSTSASLKVPDTPEHDSDASHEAYRPGSRTTRRRTAVRNSTKRKNTLSCDECHQHGRTATFGRPAELLRHTETQHRRDERFKAGLVFECPWAGCDRTGQSGFLRLDHLLEHRRGVHKENIPKRHRRRGTVSSAGTHSP